jgi:hypothetical protein
MRDSPKMPAPNPLLASLKVTQATISVALRAVSSSLYSLEEGIQALRRDRKVAGLIAARCAVTRQPCPRIASCRSTWLRLPRLVQLRWLTSEVSLGTKLAAKSMAIAWDQAHQQDKTRIKTTTTVASRTRTEQ